MTRTGGSSGAVGVSCSTSNGTATAGSDYTGTSGTLNWATGDTANKTFSIPIITDSVYGEGNETVNLTLTSPTGGATLGSPSTAVLTIVDTTPAPAGTLQFSLAAYSVNENGGSILITVTRTSGSNGAVGVSYATSNGNATAGSDYTSTSGTLSWANGDTSNKTFSISILDDSVYEGNETLNLTLSSATGGAALGSPSTAVLTIIDNDPAPPGTLQSQKIRFVTETGDAITSSGEIMSHYFISGEDGILNIIVKEPLGFVPTNPDIGIYSVAGGNCTLPGDGCVVAKAGQTFSFWVGCSTSGAILSAVYLPLDSGGSPATFNPLTGIFQWSTNADDTGKYLVEFQAEVGGMNSRTVVLINIVP